MHFNFQVGHQIEQNLTTPYYKSGIFLISLVCVDMSAGQPTVKQLLDIVLDKLFIDLEFPAV